MSEKKRRQSAIDRINTEGNVNMDLRKKHSKLAMSIDYGNSKKAAIHLFCFGCMSDKRADIKNCWDFSCPLWKQRPGATKDQQPPIVLPTKEWYQKKIDASISDAKREHGRQMGLKRNDKDV
jgi:hypothetical protein